MEGLSNIKEGKVFHSIRVLVKKILLIGIGVITNVYKLAAMIRVCIKHRLGMQFTPDY